MHICIRHWLEHIYIHTIKTTHKKLVKMLMSFCNLYLTHYYNCIMNDYSLNVLQPKYIMNIHNYNYLL